MGRHSCCNAGFRTETISILNPAFALYSPRICQPVCFIWRVCEIDNTMYCPIFEEEIARAAQLCVTRDNRSIWALSSSQAMGQVTNSPTRSLLEFYSGPPYLYRYKSFRHWSQLQRFLLTTPHINDTFLSIFWDDLHSMQYFDWTLHVELYG